MSEPTGEYSISMCSRPSPGAGGVPGHAFIAYNRVPHSGKNLQFLALGFTTAASPVKGVLSFSSIFAEPVGHLGEETFSHILENCLVLLVDKGDFDRAYASAAPYGAIPLFTDLRYSARYSLLSNDCLTFMIEVAKPLESKGVKVPARKVTDTPPGYLRRLVDSN